MPRVAVVACFHETNSFARSRTDLAAFHRWYEGDRLASAFRGTRTVVGGFLDGAAEYGLDLVPIFGAYATPAGLVTDQAFGRILDRIVDGVSSAGPIDGVLAELHGAMVTDGDDDPEATVARTLRTALGEVPIVAVTDLHANMTAECVKALDVVVGYRTNPHVDTYECGIDAVRHLAGMLRTRRPVHAAHRDVPVLASPIAQGTADLPLLRLLQRARELERRHRLLDVSVHGGYAYADIPGAGLSFTATGPDEATLQETLDELAALARQHRHEFARRMPGPDEALDHAAAMAGRETHGPDVVTDTGDNIGGGAPGDATLLLAAALERGDRTAATTIWDPETVEQAAAVGAGHRLHCRLGGKSETLGGPPLDVHPTVRWTGDGTFTNTGPMATGARTSMGRSAVLAIDTVDVVVQGLPVQPNDPELFRCVGLDPMAYDVLLLKGAAALRAGWGPVVRQFVDAGTRGVTDCSLERLPYQRVRRPIWPFDGDA